MMQGVECSLDADENVRGAVQEQTQHLRRMSGGETMGYTSHSGRGSSLLEHCSHGTGPGGQQVPSALGLSMESVTGRR